MTNEFKRFSINILASHPLVRSHGKGPFQFSCGEGCPCGRQGPVRYTSRDMIEQERIIRRIRLEKFQTNVKIATSMIEASGLSGKNSVVNQYLFQTCQYTDENIPIIYD